MVSRFAHEGLACGSTAGGPGCSVSCAARGSRLRLDGKSRRPDSFDTLNYMRFEGGWILKNSLVSGICVPMTCQMSLGRVIREDTPRLSILPVF